MAESIVRLIKRVNRKIARFHSYTERLPDDVPESAIARTRCADSRIFRATLRKGATLLQRLSYFIQEFYELTFLREVDVGRRVLPDLLDFCRVVASVQEFIEEFPDNSPLLRGKGACRVANDFVLREARQADVLMEMSTHIVEFQRDIQMRHPNRCEGRRCIP